MGQILPPPSIRNPRRVGSYLLRSGCSRGRCDDCLAVSGMLASLQLLAQTQGKKHPMEYPTLYRTIRIDGRSIFYREAGRKKGPLILLLHGLPSSSRMFEPLFARLSGRCHLVAPARPVKLDQSPADATMWAGEMPGGSMRFVLLNRDPRQKFELAIPSARGARL